MIYLILIFGIILRIINLNQSFWWDEAINVVYARDNNLVFYLTSYILGDFHPPGWFFILWVFTHAFGFNEIIARIPAVIFGVLTIYFTYLIGKIYSKTIGIFAALLLAVAPLHVYYSQEARPYALSAFAVTISNFLFLKFLKKTDTRIFLLLTLTTALILYSDYPAYFILACQFIFLLLNFRRKLFYYLKALGIALILFSPALPVLIKQLISGTNTARSVSGWADVVGGSSIKDILLLWIKILIGKISIENQQLYILAILAISFVYFVVFAKLKFNNLKNNYFLYWLIVPPVIGVAISFYIPVFSYFRFIYILPAFYLLAAAGLEKFRGLSRKVLFGILITLQITFSLIYLLNPFFHRENWREAIEFLDKTDTIVYLENSEISAPFKFYSLSNLARPALKKVPAISKEDLNLDLENTDRVLLVEYLVEVTDPYRLAEKKLTELGYKKQQVFDFRGVGFIYLYRK